MKQPLSLAAIFAAGMLALPSAAILTRPDRDDEAVERKALP